jgi:hypothetical protein
MGMRSLRDLAGKWDLAVDLPGAEEWLNSDDGRNWTRDFRLTCTRRT